MWQRVKLYPYQVGLVFEHDNFVKALTAGTHWLGINKQIRRYDRTKLLALPVHLSVLLADEIFADNVHVVQVADGELAIVYRDERFYQVLTSGEYAYWKSDQTYRFEHYDMTEAVSANNLPVALLKEAAVLRHVNAYKLMPYERALLLQKGVLKDQLAAGQYYFWKYGHDVEVLRVDLRPQTLEVSGQELLTKDKAGLRLNYQLQYQIVDAEKALLGQKNLSQQLYLRVQMALRAYVGGLNLDALLSNKEEVNSYVAKSLATVVNTLGIVVLYGGVRDIILPGDMKEIMNRVLVAEKQAQANTILRREESAATRSLLNTAKLMADNPMLLRLKEMEYLERIAEHVNNLSIAGGDQVLGQLRQLFNPME